MVWSDFLSNFSLTQLRVSATVCSKEIFPLPGLFGDSTFQPTCSAHFGILHFFRLIHEQQSTCAALPSERRVCNHCCVGMTFFYMCQQINLFFYSTLIFTDASSPSNSNQKEAVGRQALGTLSNGNLANTLQSCSLLHQFGGISVSGF